MGYLAYYVALLMPWITFIQDFLSTFSSGIQAAPLVITSVGAVAVGARVSYLAYHDPDASWNKYYTVRVESRPFGVTVEGITVTAVDPGYFWWRTPAYKAGVTVGDEAMSITDTEGIVTKFYPEDFWSMFKKAPLPFTLTLKRAPKVKDPAPKNPPKDASVTSGSSAQSRRLMQRLFTAELLGGESEPGPSPPELTR